MSLFKKNEKKLDPFSASWRMTIECLSMISESAKSTYPKEFGALLRCDDEQKDTITEIVLLPGTIAGDSHAIFQLHMKPFDLSIIGTVHSHPSPSFHPSGADKMLFRKIGKIHVIMSYPFSQDSWRAYDKNGEPATMHII